MKRVPTSSPWSDRVAQLALSLVLVMSPIHADPSAQSDSRVPVLPLERLGTAAARWEAIQDRIAPEHQASFVFLLENMPRTDVEQLDTGFLARDIALAHLAAETAPWADRIPPEIFRNYILPYINIDETREDWRPGLRELSLPLIEGCKTPAEAAMRLNERLYPKVNVQYSTRRRKANQSPAETLETGLASCTGLSILLVDACRSVGVPARLVGIPSWVDKRGNHTWVEIWDEGWHFLGAAEPDPAGLNRGWFVGDASRALRDSREHAIYAVSFGKTDTDFPMVWARNAGTVSAVNVTDRYTRDSRPVPDDETRLRVRVFDRNGGQRVAVQVTASPLPRSAEDGEESPSSPVVEGFSRDESADTNDILELPLRRGQPYSLTASLGDRSIALDLGPYDQPREQVTLYLQEVQLAGLTPPVCYVPPRGAPLSDPEREQLTSELTRFFQADPDEQSTWTFDPFLDVLLADNEAGVRKQVWETYLHVRSAGASHADFEANRVRSGDHESPYTVRAVGDRPVDGWPLFIAMHGGGNTPQEVNDRQWRIMQTYYKDQPQAGGYLYLALRAPNNTWNGFYDDYVYPLVARLIRQFLAFGDVNPNKVFLMGYSHGGYGAFAIGPKMPDHFAAIHASAAAPTDGETSARTLRNTIFTYMIGEHDTAYGRLDRNRAFDDKVRALRGTRTDIYPVVMEYKAGYRHSGLPDKDKIGDMFPAVRNPVPRELTWELTDPVIRSFFWLHVPQPSKSQLLEATCRNNRVTIQTTGVQNASVRLDSRLVRFQDPVTFTVNGQEHIVELQPSLRTLALTLMERGDPELAFTAEWNLPLQR
jgi:pimeloyl-ACP methyl ester carboxylesterase